MREPVTNWPIALYNSYYQESDRERVVILMFKYIDPNAHNIRECAGYMVYGNIWYDLCMFMLLIGSLHNQFE